jgi:hypothetical protein
MPLRCSLVSAALAATLLLCSGCATSAKNQSGSYNESGPPDMAGPASAASEGAAGTNSCTAPASAPRGSCGGCSVNCGDKQASCRSGEEWPSGAAACMRTAVCDCH